MEGGRERGEGHLTSKYLFFPWLCLAVRWQDLGRGWPAAATTCHQSETSWRSAEAEAANQRQQQELPRLGCFLSGRTKIILFNK